MKLSKVYASDGEPLGDEWVNLSGLRKDSKRAILHTLYLDTMVSFFLEHAAKQREGIKNEDIHIL